MTGSDSRHLTVPAELPTPSASAHSASVENLYALAIGLRDPQPRYAFKSRTQANIAFCLWWAWWSSCAGLLLLPYALGYSVAWAPGIDGLGLLNFTFVAFHGFCWFFGWSISDGEASDMWRIKTRPNLVVERSIGLEFSIPLGAILLWCLGAIVWRNLF